MTEVSARRIGAVVAGVLLAGAVLAGCSGGEDGGSTAATSSASADLGRVTTAADGVQEVTTQDDHDFTPDTLTVAPGRVRLTVGDVAEQLGRVGTMTVSG